MKVEAEEKVAVMEKLIIESMAVEAVERVAVDRMVVKVRDRYKGVVN